MSVASMWHAWQEQLHVAVAKGNINPPCRGVEAGDAQCHRLLPPAVIIGALPYVVGSKDVIWDYKVEQNGTDTITYISYKSFSCNKS